MMYVIFKQDGSMKLQNLGEFIQQGSSNYNVIFVAIEGFTSLTYSTAGYCTLPNSSIVVLNGVSASETIEGTSYLGYKLTLTAECLQYAGTLLMAIQCYNTTQRLVTYPISLTINETGVKDNTELNITIGQLNSYLASVSAKQDTYSNTNVRSYINPTAVNNDLSNLVENQVFYIISEDNFYKKSGSTYVSVLDAVTIDKTQTITGAKTFTSDITLTAKLTDGTHEVAVGDIVKHGDNDPTLSVGEAEFAKNIKLETTEVSTIPYKFDIVGNKANADVYSGFTATLEKLQGVSLAFNQLYYKDAPAGTETKNGVTFTKNSDGSWTVNGTATADAIKNVGKSLTDEIVIGHKYLIHGCKGEGSNSTFFLTFNSVGYASNDYGSGAVFTHPNNAYGRFIAIVIKSGVTVENVKFYPQLIDLTLMFGNNARIPNGLNGTNVLEYAIDGDLDRVVSPAAIFNRLFPKPYYPYNAGTIVSVKTDGKLKITSKNAFDGVLEQGGIQLADGGNYSTTVAVRSKNYIKVIPEQIYVLFQESVAGITTRYIHEYDEDNNHLGNQYLATQTKSVLLSPNTHYVRFSYFRTDGDISPADVVDVYFQLRHSGDHLSYAEHEIIEHDIPSVELKGIYGQTGDTYEASGKKTVRYGVVDLGTLTWNYDSSNIRFYCYLDTAKSVPQSNIVANALCQKYEVGTASNTLPTASLDKILSLWTRLGHTDLYVKDTAYTDAATFKTAMNGVYLVYELASDTETFETAYTSILDIDDMGTLEFTQPATNIYSPVGHRTEYQPYAADMIKTNKNRIGVLEEGKQDKLTAGTGIDITNNVISATGETSVYWGNIEGTLSNQTDLNTALNGKQTTLVSGTNIKTINSQSILGSGNLSVSQIDDTTTASDKTWSSTKTNTELTNVREVAEGKCKSYIIDAQTDITGTKDANDNYTNVTAITGITLADLSLGDVILIKALEVPDYWVSQITPSISLNKLETSKVDLDNYVTTNTAQTISGAKTFSSNLTLTGNLSDGTNEVSVAEIKGATDGIITITAPSSTTLTDSEYAIFTSGKIVKINGTFLGHYNPIFLNSTQQTSYGLVGLCYCPNFNHSVNINIYILNTSTKTISAQGWLTSYNNGDTRFNGYSLTVPSLVCGTQFLSIKNKSFPSYPTANTNPQVLTIASNGGNLSWGDVSNLLSAVSGYDATKTQTLKNINGTLTWVDD